VTILTTVVVAVPVRVDRGRYGADHVDTAEEDPENGHVFFFLRVKKKRLHNIVVHRYFRTYTSHHATGGEA